MVFMKLVPFIAVVACHLLMLVGGLQAADDPAIGLSALSPEDQEIVKGLKFSKIEPAPLDTRTWTYIKCRVQVNSKTESETIVSKLQLETRLLFRDLKKEWYVLKCRASFDALGKGTSTAELSFREQNKLIGSITGDQKARSTDEHTIIRYDGVVIYEDAEEANAKLPAEWWTKEGSLGPAETAPASPVASGVDELDSLRRLVESRLGSAAWKPFEQAASSLRAKYLAAVERAIASAQAAAKLDEALELKREQEIVTKGGEVEKTDPLKTHASLAALRTTYHEAYSKIEAQRDRAAAPIIQAYQTEIDTLVSKLTKSGKLDAAMKVRDARSQPFTPSKG